MAYGGWELPEAITAYRNNAEVILALPRGVSKQVHPPLGRFVWARAENGHLGPAAKCETSGFKQFWLIAKLTFPSKKKAGCIASLFARFARWNSGARRRRTAQPPLIQLATTQSFQQWSLSTRAWWPTTVEAWRADSPKSF